MQKLVLLQTAVGDYRKAFLELMVERLGLKFLLLTGSEYFDGTTKTRVDLGPNQRFIRNRFLWRRLSWQTGCWRPVLSAQVVIFELNPRILSNWPLLLIRKLLRKRSAVWGHAWPRAGRSRKTKLRDAMCRLAGNVVAYTESEAADFRARLPGVKVYVAPNALYRRLYFGAVGDPISFIYVGRLVAEKKPQLLVEAFSLIVRDAPDATRLLIVGDGPEREKLYRVARDLGCLDKVEFAGHVGELDQLKRYYGRSLASVSPGYVGLSLIQSLSFGVPMIIADKEKHAPEIDAAMEDVNCVMFRAGDSKSLADAMRSMLKRSAYWTDQKATIESWCSERYSAEVMAEGMLQLVQFDASA